MNSVISINQIANLPNNKLAIIKDTNDGICLGIKSNCIDISNIEFKARNLFIDKSAAYTLMIRSNNADIYKCIVPLDTADNKNSVHKLITLDRFNLVVFRDENEQDIFRIENINKNELKDMLYNALISQDDTIKSTSVDNITSLYTDEQLWNLK